MSLYVEESYLVVQLCQDSTPSSYSVQTKNYNLNQVFLFFSWYVIEELKNTRNQSFEYLKNGDNQSTGFLASTFSITFQKIKFFHYLLTAFIVGVSASYLPD